MLWASKFWFLLRKTNVDKYCAEINVYSLFYIIIEIVENSIVNYNVHKPSYFSLVEFIPEFASIVLSSFLSGEIIKTEQIQNNCVCS